MQKPFDVADLGERLKANGLPAVEGLAEVVASQVFNWLSDSLVLEAASNPLFAIGVPVLKALEPLILAEVKKIAPEAPAAPAP
jgi:hypothetical protein